MCCRDISEVQSVSSTSPIRNNHYFYYDYCYQSIMDYYHVPIPTPEFEIDGKKVDQTTSWLYTTVLADQTERNLTDLDYIPTEELFCKNKYKKMVNI